MTSRPLWLSLLILLTLAGLVPLASAEGEDTYVVRPGDVLGTIAQRLGTSVEEVIRLNGLASADRIFVGQALLIPGQAVSGYHVVLKGETLAEIANAYDVSVASLTAANQLFNPNLLQPGQHLVIPQSRAGAPRGGSREELASDASAAPAAVASLVVPYRTQLDGTTYEESNCGPATLGMLMAYYNEWWSTDGIRRDVNRFTGDYSRDGGSDWESLAYAARKRGFAVFGITTSAGYRRWTIDDLVAETSKGRPPMLLVRYSNLPGHENSSWWGDHYIVFLGLTPDGSVIYHDAAFQGTSLGAYRTMSQRQLLRAWSTNAAGIQNSAMVIDW